MRFKPGTTNEEAKAKLAAFAEKQRNAGMNPGPMPEPPRPNPRMEAVRQKLAEGQQRANEISARLQQQRAELEARQAAMRAANNSPRPQPLPQRPMQPQTQPRPPVPPDLQTPLPRPGGTFQADLGRPAPIGPDGKPLVMGQIMGPGPNQVALNPDQRRIQEEEARRTMGFQQATGSPMPGSTFGNQQAPMMTGPKSAQTTPPPVGLPAIRGAQATPQVASPSTPAFKKGGKVAAKAPVKKAAGGKVAAKAPVKKAVGGPIKAKTAAKPAAKMAKPMPAMKRGGKVMAKGRKK